MDTCRIQQWIAQPVGQKPSAHGSDGKIQNVQQGSLTVAGTNIARQFQIPAALVVHHEKLPQKIGLDGRQVFNLLALGFAHIVDQCTGSPHAGLHRGTSEPF